ncbi:MAG: tryptophan-rich sensory protein [Parcubacteria bacterium C7867-002]|nr:MAG: tryptophan-rich sensory protein [Parcubacteria bacterium C7867-002]
MLLHHHTCYHVFVRLSSILKLTLSIVVCQLAGVVGAVFTTSSVQTWYGTLVRPELAPPNWVFGPVWTILFTLMGVAVFLVWKKGIEHGSVRSALRIFALQLVLNTLWSIIFFNFQNVGGALIEIAFLWIAILATIIMFHKVSRIAAYLLVPYILWVSFAAYLNYTFYILN